jgi:hypothetical protein
MGLAAPALNAEPGLMPEELQLARLPRKSLVAELMSLRPELDMKGSLMHFKRPKLARMLAEARAAFAAANCVEVEERLQA